MLPSRVCRGATLVGSSSTGIGDMRLCSASSPSTSCEASFDVLTAADAPAFARFLDATGVDFPGDASTKWVEDRLPLELVRGGVLLDFRSDCTCAASPAVSFFGMIMT